MSNVSLAYDPSATLLQMFQWPWDSIAAECPILNQIGYTHVQTSPPQEHVLVAVETLNYTQPWWTDYQPTSYNLTSKRGNRTQLENMITTCAANNVTIVFDTIVNHMAGVGANENLTAFGGTVFSKYSYPIYDPTQFHYCAGNGTALNIVDFTNATEVEYCELVGLSDLDQNQESVRTSLQSYLNNLISLGAGGFRIDAAKHVPPSNFSVVVSGLTNQSSLLITQEVSASDPTAPAILQPPAYTDNGYVQAFNVSQVMRLLFLNSSYGGIQNLLTNFGTGQQSGLDGNRANVFVTNHDTERDNSTLNYKAPNNSYILSTVFLLGYSTYGIPTVYTGYNFTDRDAGAPQSNTTFLVNPVTCGEDGWRCEHRSTSIANMVTMRRAIVAANASIDNAVAATANRISWSRGSVGFVAINNDAEAWTASFNSSLTAGNYCNIIANNATACANPITVSQGGTINTTVPAFDAVALMAM